MITAIAVIAGKLFLCFLMVMALVIILDILEFRVNALKKKWGSLCGIQEVPKEKESATPSRHSVDSEPLA